LQSANKLLFFSCLFSINVLPLSANSGSRSKCQFLGAEVVADCVFYFWDGHRPYLYRGHGFGCVHSSTITGDTYGINDSVAACVVALANLSCWRHLALTLVLSSAYIFCPHIYISLYIYISITRCLDGWNLYRGLPFGQIWPLTSPSSRRSVGDGSAARIAAVIWRALLS
jgi:hypothetical protein